ncbi:MAG: TetR/AcrR family transcriptional regulator [Pseudomonadota bacterium]
MSATKKPARTQQDRKDQAEEALLNAAEHLITEQGIEKTSLAQIGELAGYSRGLVNHHFGSKNALLARLSERMQRDFAKSQGESRQRNGLETLLRTVDQYFRMKHARGTRGGTFFLIWANAINAQDNTSFSRTEEVARDQIKRILQVGLEDGSISSSVNPDSLALITVAILRGIALQALIDPKKIRLLKERERVLTFLRESLGTE